MPEGDAIPFTSEVQASWARISKRAYWSRHVELAKWKEFTRAGRRGYLPEAVLWFDPREFIAFYGREDFRLDWPRLRDLLPEYVLSRRRGLYDHAWSLIESNTPHLRPWVGFFKIPAREREFLIEVARDPGASTYAIAKRLNMQYRRALDHRKALLEIDRIQAKEVVRDGRRTLSLYPAYGNRLEPKEGRPETSHTSVLGGSIPKKVIFKPKSPKL